MERDGQGPRLFDGRVDLAVTHVKRVALRGGGQINGRLGKGQFPFRGSEKMVGLHGIDRHGQRSRVRIPHILRREADHAPGKIQRVLARLEHPAQPVEGRIGIAPPKAFVEGGNQVVVFLAALVVLERFFLDRPLDEGERHPVTRFPRLVGQRSRGFQTVEGGAGIPVRRPDDPLQGFRFDLETQAAQPPFFVGKGVLQDPLKIFLGERLEDQHTHPGEKR